MSRADFVFIERGGLLQNGRARRTAEQVPVMLLLGSRGHGLGHGLFIGLMDHADIHPVVMRRVDVAQRPAPHGLAINKR